MKASDRIALRSILIAVCLVGALNYWLGPFGWGINLFLGIVSAGAWFQADLRLHADASVVDSKSLNG